MNLLFFERKILGFLILYVYEITRKGYDKIVVQVPLFILTLF